MGRMNPFQPGDKLSASLDISIPSTEWRYAQLHYAEHGHRPQDSLDRNAADIMALGKYRLAHRTDCVLNGSTGADDG